MSTLEAAVEGGKIALMVRDRGYGKTPHVNREMYVVTKVTATQLVARQETGTVERRFRRKDGMELKATHGSMFASIAEMWTPELQAEHEAQKAARERWMDVVKKADMLAGAIQGRSFTVEQMESLVRVYEDIRSQ